MTTMNGVDKKGLIIDTGVAQYSLLDPAGERETSQVDVSIGKDVMLEMKDWLARSNPSSPIGSPGAGQNPPTRPIDLSSYLASASPPPNAGSSSMDRQGQIRPTFPRRETLEQTMMARSTAAAMMTTTAAAAMPNKLKKPRSAWNLRAATGPRDSTTEAGSIQGWGGFVNRLRSRSSHNLKADAKRDVSKESLPPPLPIGPTGGYKSLTVPVPHNAVSSTARDTLEPRPGTSQGVYHTMHQPNAHPHRISLGDELVLQPHDRSRSGSAAPSAMTYTSASSSTSGWSSRFPTPAVTPMNIEGDVRVEVDPFDLTSPTADMFNFTELGFLRETPQQLVQAGTRDRYACSSESAGPSSRYSVFGFGAGEPKSIGKKPSKARLSGARSFRDLRAAAGGLFGPHDHGLNAGLQKRGLQERGSKSPSPGPSATLRYRRSAAKLGGGDDEDEDKVVQKRSSMSWLRGTLKRKDVPVKPSDDSVKGTIPEMPSVDSLDGEVRIPTDVMATAVPQQQVLPLPVQRIKARPALTITLPSSQSLCGNRPAVPLSLSDEHGNVLASTQSAKRNDNGEAAHATQQLGTTALPASTGSFTDLYAELGISPPGESDEEEMPYSPRLERPIDAFSFGDILASLGSARPIEVATPDKTHSVVIGKGSAGTSIVSSGRETKRSSWRSSRHSIKPASAPPTANLPPLPPLAHLQPGEVSLETASPCPPSSAHEQPISPRLVDLSSGKSSAIELGFEPFQHIRSWEETRAEVPGDRPVSDSTDAADATPDTQSEDPDLSMDYGFLDTYHDVVDINGCTAPTVNSTGASGSAPTGTAAKSQDSINRPTETTGDWAAQGMHRGRDSVERQGRGGPSRSRSGSRSPRRPPLRAGSPVSDDDTDDDQSDDSNGSHSHNSEESGSDDDVPLAKRIPGALKAQRTLRRGAKRSSRPGNSVMTPRMERRRPGINGRDNPNWEGEGGVPARALEQKLLALTEPRIGSSPATSDTYTPHQYRSTSLRVPRPPAPSHQNSSRNVTGPVPSSSTQSDLSRHASVSRSASRMQYQRSVENSPVFDSTGFSATAYIASRSQTPAIPPMPRIPQAFASGHQPIDGESSGKEWLASRSSSIRRPNRLRSGSNSDHPPSSGTSSNMVSRKPSLSIQPGDRPASRKASATHPTLPTSPLVDSHVASPRQRQASSDKTTVAPGPDQTVVSRQAVYLESMQGEQRLVELKTSTTAAEVLVQVLGSTTGQGFMGDWILFEIFGEYHNMERPVRSFESLVAIMKGWNGDLKRNAFLAKKSPLDRLTRVDMMPRVHPMHGVYVQHETKRGKWSKRWIELRNGNVFIAKNDRGKESDFLCSSSAFDPYILHGNSYKGPKPFVVVLKSREPATLFESPGDYLHVFSLDSAPGIQLMEALFTAKSCAMIQAANTPAAAYAPVAHTTPSVPERKPQQPLIDLKSTGLFTGGSLLSKLAGRR